jgi:hypothetical protein
MCLIILESVESFVALISIMQRAVKSSHKKTTIRFEELNQKKYRTPLIVISWTFELFQIKSSHCSL